MPHEDIIFKEADCRLTDEYLHRQFLYLSVPVGIVSCTSSQVHQCAFRGLGVVAQLNPSPWVRKLGDDTFRRAGALAVQNVYLGAVRWVMHLLHES